MGCRRWLEFEGGVGVVGQGGSFDFPIFVRSVVQLIFRAFEIRIPHFGTVIRLPRRVPGLDQITWRIVLTQKKRGHFQKKLHET